MLNVVLYAPRIPQNTGQLARTCLAMQCRLHLIRPLGFRLDAPGLRRAAVGYLKSSGADEAEAAAALHGAGLLTIHAGVGAFRASLPPTAQAWLFTCRGRRSYLDAPIAAGDYLVFGNETEGLPLDWLAADADHTVAIPMLNPQVRCLNLAAAATAALFEALRRLGALEVAPNAARPSVFVPTNDLR